MDSAWHVYVLAAAWAKRKYPMVGKDGRAAFGSLISDLAAGRIWADIDSEYWAQIDDRAAALLRVISTLASSFLVRQVQAVRLAALADAWQEPR